MNDVSERSELLQPEPAEALGGLLGVDVPDLASDGLPLLWHWIYLLDRPAQADLGPDGHPVRGTLVAPPGPNRRRMWAGGEVRVHRPLRCGQIASRQSQIRTVVDKNGRTGTLTFVTVDHQIRQNDRVVIDERQDIVYREATGSTPTAPAPAADQPAAADDWSLEITPTLLFRYSALTYNAHRIHYDRDYATDVEGYPGLVTHGPLQALAMAESARANGHTGNLRLEYRMTAPLFDHQGLIARTDNDNDSIVTSVRDIHGRQTAHGTVTPG